MISITVPTRNRPGHLMRALASIAAQTVRDVQILVVDDGDGSGAAAARGLGHARLETLISGGAGQVAARNMAIAAARGDTIAWLDDDDWWEEADHLARIVATIADKPCLAHASGRLVHETEARVATGSLPFQAAMTLDSASRDNTLLASGIAYPARLHAEIGRFDEALPIYWDWDWYLRVLRHGLPAVATGGTGVCISVRSDNTSGNANTDLRRADLARFAAKNGLSGLVLKNHEDVAREQEAAVD